jgi:sulfate adenylyltransferase
VPASIVAVTGTVLRVRYAALAGTGVQQSMGAFKEPHGGVLRELYLGESATDAARDRARDLPSWDLTERQMCDLELLLNGAFSPLAGFQTRVEYEHVLTHMRLPGGEIWPIPITLDVSAAFAESLSTGATLALRDPQGVLIATLAVEDIWEPDRTAEAEAVYGTADRAHPGVDYLINRANPVYIGGALSGIEPPMHHDFRLLRDSPSELRGRFRKLGWRKVVAYQTHTVIHRAEQEFTFSAARECEANLLIHPVVGMSKPGDVDHYTRVRCYEQVLREYPEQTTTLSLLNLARRQAGPREVLWQAIVRKNFGCTHFIVEYDDVGPVRASDGEPFYEQGAAQTLYRRHEEELDITMVPVERMYYVEDRGQHMPASKIAPGMKTLSLTPAELERRLHEGVDIPEWFSYPKVIEELKRTRPPRHRQGFTVFFTGLSGAGKSTIASALMVKLLEMGDRRVTLLDGDLVRRNLSSELGFSKEHRDLNILRIGFVASEITKNGGVAICAPIAPYAATRREIRALIEPLGGFIEVYVATPLGICEARDRKGLYAKARAGLVPNFTGISDPYEEPERAELTIDTRGLTPELAAHRILVKLESLGFIR